MAILRFILLPFSFLYGCLSWVRNKFFDWGILPSKAFNLPIISVGNLSVGGTGKTPHVEYLIRLLKKENKLAVLSRGYKRKSKGFVMADENCGISELGDEAFQLTKFDDILVAVDEKRVHGIKMLTQRNKNLDAIILDDAFQHRYVKPGLSILLTDYYNIYKNDFMLPSGNLREFTTGAKRADIILVTKSPKIISPITRRNILKMIKPKDYQQLFFSRIKHGNFSPIPGVDFIPAKESKISFILLFSGIANTYPLEEYLKGKCKRLEIFSFPDHHQFTISDLEKLEKKFNDIFAKKKIIVTTEKDVMRLQFPELREKINHLPICYVPIEVAINKKDREKFNQIILNYVEANK
ncbi:MAG: tetraacyldisaccharide 4'-kinase [Bacteroidales bacterium]